MPNNRRRMTSLVIIAICVVITAIVFLIWRQWFETYHFAVVQNGVLYRDGNRGPREFATMVRKCRPKTIVSLVDDQEIADPEKPEFKAEIDLAQQQGITIDRIPIPLGGWPTTENVQRFLEIVSDPSHQPVIVHCAQGVRRTGMMAAAFQESVLGYDSQKTKAAILRFGHSQRSIGDVERFIDVYDPVKREVTKQLEPSRE
jgi:protein tyrosine/serine phosphatase